MNEKSFDRKISAVIVDGEEITGKKNYAILFKILTIRGS